MYGRNVSNYFVFEDLIISLYLSHKLKITKTILNTIIFQIRLSIGRSVYVNGIT